MDKKILILIIVTLLLGGGIFVWYQFGREPLIEVEVEEIAIVATTWKRTFGGTGLDEGRSVQQTNDGGFIIAGATRSFGAGGDDVWLIKTDAQGNKEWDRAFGGKITDKGYSVQQTTDGGFIIAGETRSFGAGGDDVWLIKVDAQGNKEWNRTFGGERNDRAHSVRQTADSGFIIAGETRSFGAGGDDVWLIKIDAQGNKEWDRTFGDENGERGHSVQQTTDGGFIITGRTFSFDTGEEDVWLIKTDAQGNKEWDRIFGDEGNDRSYSVQQTNDGGFIITGVTRPFGAGEWDAWLIKTDAQGNKEWERTFGGGEGGSSWGRSVQQVAGDGFIIVGGTNYFGAGEIDVWLIKTDAQGNKEWSRIFGVGGWNDGYSVQQTTDGGFIITGRTEFFGTGEGDVWLIKTDAHGSVNQ